MSDNYISHSGTPHDGVIPHSGRYPWGSGPNAYQRGHDFMTEYKRYLNQGLTQKEIATRLGFINKFGEPDLRGLKARYSLAVQEQKYWELAEIKRLHDQEGLGWTEIGNKLNLSESTVRSKYKNDSVKLTDTMQYVESLKDYVDKYKYVDVSAGENIAFGITDNRFKTIVDILEKQGYEKNIVYIDQMGTNNKTKITVLSPPGTEYSDVYEHKYDIKSLDETGRIISSDGIISLGMQRPPSISSDRIKVVYNEEGGVTRDGLIQIRRGLDDLSLGDSLYAQVRIAVDDTHYLKGMCIYSDDMPPGIDVIFNTNKHLGTPILGEDKNNSVLKKLERTKDGEVDWEYPFGTSVTQQQYEDKNGNLVVSPINIVNKEGDWLTWDKNLASQFLSKQPKYMAEQQLKLSYLDKKEEYEKIAELTNPAIKQQLLTAFADKCDSMAVDLKAHAFPGQQTHVILPFNSIGDNEIYAPRYDNGTRLALVRYPHGGKFEIPILTVNNKNKEAIEAIGKMAPDAVGINSHTAVILSGADFDGDTAVVIPLSDKVKVQTISANHPSITALRNFEPKDEYAGYPGMKNMTPQEKGIQMGVTTNLITDMTLKGAPLEHIVKATEHSMVVIDAEKHHLDWKRSEKDHDIQELKDLYQDNGGGKHGASTIISRASAPQSVDQRKQFRYGKNTIDPETGEKLYSYTKEEHLKGKLLSRVTNADGTDTYINRIQTDRTTGQHYYISTDSTGKKNRVYFNDDQYTKGTDVYLNKAKDGRYYYVHMDPSTRKTVRTYVSEDQLVGGYAGIKKERVQQKSTQMAEAKDAYDLVSKKRYPIELVYADYANGMKSLANKARLEYLHTKPLEYSPDAFKEYREEVKSLNAKYENALTKAPKERQAQLMANRTIAVKKEEHPELAEKENKDTLSKYKERAIHSAREKLGIKKEDYVINITDREWEAIQKGAIRHSKVSDILKYADLDQVKERATPRKQKNISPAMEQLAISMKNRGFTVGDIADRLGISTSSVYNITKSS